MPGFEPIVRAISLWMARLGGAALLGVAILIAVEVSLRSSGLETWSIGTELASYALALGATWSLAYVVFERAHVRVDVLVRKLPPKLRGALDTASMASLTLFGAVLTYGAVEMLTTSIQLGSRSNTTLGVPLALPQGLWTFGLGWFTAVGLFRFAQALSAQTRGKDALLAAIAASPGADEEVEDAIQDTRTRLSKEATR